MPSSTNHTSRTPLIDTAEHHRVLIEEERRLLEFGRAALLDNGGFGWLNNDGCLTPDQPALLYVTCRMTHVYALAHLRGVEGAASLVDHGLTALDGLFRDEVNGGWFTSVAADGPRDTWKWAYPHAFVVLATASATVAGRPRASGLLAEALSVLGQRFWDTEAGMLIEEWDAQFITPRDYRGANSNMHGVEAMLAGYAATGDATWLNRALRVSERMVGVAAAHHWRLPEHYDRHWVPLLNHNHAQPDDPFHPYGATPGHSFEWARLLLQIRAGLEAIGDEPPSWLLEGAASLFKSAVHDAWSVDGAAGFIYTIGWAGEPIIHQRLHWVLCEALGAAAALWKVTRDEQFAQWYAIWWDYANIHLIDRSSGSWHHELDSQNRPAATIRNGKADLYHAVQATLLPRLPVAPALATVITDAT